MKRFFGAACAVVFSTAAAAQDMVTYSTTDSFDDVIFGLENAITDKGLLVDAVSHVGEMLERTRADVGSDVVLFRNADVISFCSAALSRKVMEADPMNIRFCPYDVFVAQTEADPDNVIIGYRTFPDGPMKEVEALLDEIVHSALDLD